MKEYISIPISQHPKTLILVSPKLKKREIQVRKKRFLDENGKLRINTVGEYETINSKYSK